MLLLSNVGHVLEGPLLNVLNCFSNFGETLQPKLILCTRLADLEQLNQELFIPVP